MLPGDGISRQWFYPLPPPKSIECLPPKLVKIADELIFREISLLID